MTRWTLDDFWNWVRIREANSLGGAGTRRESRDQRVNDALVRWSRQLSRLDALAQRPAAAAAYVAELQPLAQELATPDMPAPIPPETAAAPQPAAVFVFPSVEESTKPAHEAPLTSEAPEPEEIRVEPEIRTGPAPTNYYEILQISRNADDETVHRVYRIMASRFHPDNPRTGNVEKFMALQRAYEVLSDPVERARYDALHPAYEAPPLPIFELKDFVEGIEGEKNRRLGVLSLLYHRRRLNELSPGMSLLELERRMSFPREYLEFTLWYLRTKGYVEFLDQNSDYGVTAAGVDYVEQHSSTNNVIRELLTAGSHAGTGQQPTHVVTGAPLVGPRIALPQSRRSRRRSHGSGRRALAR
ncbi:MAG TPA: DnaJ domain-containing protein [Bryobacteraceae bacterium]